MKKILFVASESDPFIKTGGLGEVVGALPKYVNRKKYDIRVILPKYVCMDERYEDDLIKMGEIPVKIGWREQYAAIYKTTFDNIVFYFIDNSFYFNGDTPYDNIYLDFEKFAFFSKAVIESLRFFDFIPDIIHCHDWQTGLVPVYLHDMVFEEAHNIKSILTIHNMRYQGRMEMGLAKDITGLEEWYFKADKLEFYGEVNCLKGGLVFADKITTVSTTYACDLMTQEGGEGLDGLMRAKSLHLVGIENGINYQKYNPKKDAFITCKYDESTIRKGKNQNKKALQKEFMLPVDEDIFLIGMVTRLTEQKGMNLIHFLMQDMDKIPNIQLVILGSGIPKYEHMLLHYAHMYPEKIAVMIGYSDEVAHRIYAGADAYLMPSMFEPCGLSQMISKRYGTLPIVRETGGLKDTVTPYNQYEQTGNGFGFTNFNYMEMQQVLLYAKDIYENKKSDWYAMVKRAMKDEHSWQASAKKYEKLYDSLLNDDKYKND